MKRLQIGIIGPEKCNYPENSQLQNKLEMYAEKVGELLAERNAVVLTGGGDGVMEAVFRGAKRKNGLTVGIPGKTRGISNPYTDVEILTPLDIGDFLIAGILSSDAIIVIGSSAGTLSELAYAYRWRIPIIILRGFDPDYDKMVGNYLDRSKKIQIYGADTPEEAVAIAIKSAKKRLKRSKV
jgi:uncharacterized protein (TIGR00725 family)